MSYFRYTEDLLDFVTTQQCIVVRGRPIAAVIHQPFTGHAPTLAAAPDSSAKVKLLLSNIVNCHKQVFLLIIVDIIFSFLCEGQIFGGLVPQDPEGVALSAVAVSRSHTGGAADLVAEAFPGKSSLFAGGASIITTTSFSISCNEFSPSTTMRWLGGSVGRRRRLQGLIGPLWFGGSLLACHQVESVVGQICLVVSPMQ